MLWLKGSLLVALAVGVTWLAEEHRITEANQRAQGILNDEERTSAAREHLVNSLAFCIANNEDLGRIRQCASGVVKIEAFKTGDSATPLVFRP